MLGAASVPRPDFTDRRTRLALGITVIGALAAGLIYAVGTGDWRLTAYVSAVAIAPALLVLALKRSYLFPYGIYVALIPFDNMLKIAGSGTLTKMLGILSTAFIVIYAFRRKGLNAPPLSLYLWLTYLAWLLLSLLWSADVANGILDAQVTVSLIGMFAVLAVAPVDERDLRAICACIVLGGVASSFYGIYLLHDAPTIETIGGQAGRLMINVDNRTIDANHFANAMLTPIALAMVAMLNSRKLRTILGALFALIVLLAGEAVALSREAMLACIVIVAITVFFSRRRALGIALFGGMIALVPLLVPAIFSRITDALATGGAGRTSIWETGWTAFKLHPVIGWGAGGAIEAYDRTYLKVFQAYNAGWSRPPHNTPLQVMVELGVIGFVLFGAAFIATFRHFRGIPRTSSLYDLKIAFTAALIGLAVCSLFIGLETYKYVWVALATTAQLRTVARSQQRRPQPAIVYEPPPAAPAPARSRARARRDRPPLSAPAS